MLKKRAESQLIEVAIDDVKLFFRQFDPFDTLEIRQGGYSHRNLGLKIMDCLERVEPENACFEGGEPINKSNLIKLADQATIDTIVVSFLNGFNASKIAKAEEKKS